MCLYVFRWEAGLQSMWVSGRGFEKGPVQSDRPGADKPGWRCKKILLKCISITFHLFISLSTECTFPAFTLNSCPCLFLTLFYCVPSVTLWSSSSLLLHWWDVECLSWVFWLLQMSTCVNTIRDVWAADMHRPRQCCSVEQRGHRHWPLPVTQSSKYTDQHCIRHSHKLHRVTQDMFL